MEHHSNINVALYARVSDNKQVLKDNSLPAQIEGMKKYCEKRGWQICNIFKEEGRTGTNDKRPEFQKMIQLAQEKSFNAIVVWSLSRFARNREQSIVYKIRLKKLGIRVVSVTENIEGSDDFGERIYEAIIEVIDEMESKRISDRTFAAMNKLAKEGFWAMGGQGPFGYTVKKVKVDGVFRKKLIKDNDNARIVKTIFKEYLNGKGAKQIANDMNCKGIHFRNNSWSTNAVLGILNNETYTGKLIWNKRGEAIKMENCFDPIIDNDTFYKAESIRQSRQFDTTNPNIYRSEYLFHALIKCECGASIHGASANGNGGKYLYYQCSSKKYGQAKCKNKSINRNSFENFILKSIKNHILTEKNMMTLADDTNKISKAKYESDKLMKDILKERLQILKVRINNTQNMLADNDLEDQKAGFSMLGDFRKEENEIQDQLAQIGNLTFKPFEKSDIDKYSQKTRGNLQILDFEKKRQFLQTFIQKITVTSDRKIFIEYDLPLMAGNAVRTVGVNHGSSPTLYAPRPGLEPGTR
ncbi:MAG: recombinase family protein [Spirochaetia bacterium]|nr:recombinase family protein [Spirochaetia bacterium]